MRVIEARNVNQALPKGLWLLGQHGIERASRNGPVMVMRDAVTTEYAQPCERVVFWAQRDANPAFHLFEAIWMLAGRHDLAPLTRYVKDFGKFSDDGETLRGAYGKRWRNWFTMDGYAPACYDQLPIIAERLRRDPEDRRCILQMWDADEDLGRVSRDIPCNTMASFQRDADGRLDMTVFCRSNDIILGAYGANAVHFGFLLEYMALWVGCPVGIYRQVSVNWHAYKDAYLSLKDLPATAMNWSYAWPHAIDDEYTRGVVRVLPLTEPRHGESADARIERLDAQLQELLLQADTGFALPRRLNDDEPFIEMAYTVLRAHQCWRHGGPDRYLRALDVLACADTSVDWNVAMTQWIERRQAKAVARQARVEVV